MADFNDKQKPQLSEQEVLELIEDLRTHQLELEMQNDELRTIQKSLEESRAKYTELYDFAPVGYLSFSDNGIILEANVTIAGLLGEETSTLVNQPLSKFIVDEHQDTFHQHRRLLQTSRKKACCELQLRRHDGRVFWAGIESVVTMTRISFPERIYQCAITDITDRKKNETIRLQAHVELESQVYKRTAALRMANIALQEEINERKHLEIERLKLERQVLQGQKLESLGVLAGGIAHDFNNLLMGILGYTDLTIQSPLLPS